MKKIIYIMGKSASGKDSIYKKVLEKLDIDTYIMYTTRPKREGEIDGQTYNYITYEQMQEYKVNPKKEKLIELRRYNTVHGIWEYATIKDIQFEGEKDMVMLGTLESYRKVKQFFNQESIKGQNMIIPVYIEVEDGERLIRAIKREKEQINPDYKEMCRRFIVDTEDFSEQKLFENGIVKRFENNNMEDCVQKIIDYINTF